VLREQPHLGQRIEHHAPRLAARHLLENGARGVAELDVRRVEEARLLVRIQGIFGGQQLVGVDAGEAPAVRARHPVELLLGFGERNVQALVVTAPSFQKELEREGGLARARVSLDEVDAIRGEATVQDAVEPGDSGANLFFLVNHWGCSWRFFKMRGDSIQSEPGAVPSRT
jgi:hypothetical protein